MALGPKLQLRSGMTLAIVGVPTDPPTIDAPQGEESTADAVLLYAHHLLELERGVPTLAAAASRGALSWVAYPKAKQLGTDLNRDLVRRVVQASGLETVRQVALDDTWSALRVVSRTDP